MRSDGQKAVETGPHARLMSPERLEKLREGVKTVHPGDRRESVVVAVGEPDATEIVGPKRPHSTPEDSYDLVYEISLVGSSRGNTNDKIVTISFDHSGRLVSIRSNVEGIETRQK